MNTLFYISTQKKKKKIIIFFPLPPQKVPLKVLNINIFSLYFVKIKISFYYKEYADSIERAGRLSSFLFHRTNNYIIREKQLSMAVFVYSFLTFKVLSAKFNIGKDLPIQVSLKFVSTSYINWKQTNDTK